MSADQDPDTKKQVRFLAVCTGISIVMAVFGAILDSTDHVVSPIFATPSAASAPAWGQAPGPAAMPTPVGARW